MAEEIFKLKTLDVENTLVRQSRVGFKNNPTSKIVFASPDTMGDEIYSGETGIYTGERQVNTEYLIQGSVGGNNIRTEATFTKKQKEVVLSNPISGLKEGDKIRNDIDNSFYEIKSVAEAVITLVGEYDSTSFEGSSFSGPATIRKEKIGNAEFEYARSLSETGLEENKIFFNQDKLEWGVTGGQFEGPIDTQKLPYVFPADDYMVAQFQEATTSGAPVITAVKSGRFTVVNDNKNRISDLSLNAIPFPHETLKIYWGPKDKDLPLKKEGVDYVVNYSQEPDYQFPFPPMEDRQVAFLKFLGDLDEKQATVNENFEGYIAITKTTDVPNAESLVTSVTDITPDSEKIRVSDTILSKNKDYIIDYESGLTTFVDHKNNEQIVQSITYAKSLLWDGVSVIKGISSDKVIGSLNPEENNNLVVRPITGLVGIDHDVYFEDTEDNNLVRDEDYILEYDGGAIRINDSLEENECVLISYYVEGQQEISEDLVGVEELRTKKFPIMSGSIVLTKVYTDVINIERTKVLEEGVDYEISALTGAIRPLADSLTGDNVKSLTIAYIPMAQMNVILQPNLSDTNSFRMTVIDDALDITSPVALKFKVRNPQISVPEDDPFKSNDDPSKTSYANSIIQDSIQNVSIRIRSGFGTASEELLVPGVTENLGVSTDTDLDLTGYTYDDELKEIQLDESANNSRPDFNDVVVMTYSFFGDTLPYVPIEAIFPVIGGGSSQFYIEGQDRTDLLKPESILRIDNFNPEEIYYVKLKTISFDGESTKVEIYGTFPTDIRNPSFFLLDSDITFSNLPEGSQVAYGLKPGSNVIRITGNLLQVTEAIEENSILEIDGTEIYRVLSVSVGVDEVILNIFPTLQSYIDGNVLVSTFPVRDEGTTTIVPRLRALTSPQQPAFTIHYVTPKDPVELSGGGLITIDTEKIILQEIVSGNTNPTPYLFYFRDYVDAHTLAKAIQATQSSFLGLNYTPFTVSVDGVEQYYLGTGVWASDTILPFKEGTEESLPYTVFINPDMYKWKLIAAEKGANKFTVEEADISSSFSEGNLLAFTSKVTGGTYYHIVSGTTVEDNKDNDSLKDTTVLLKDDLRINFSDPYLYRYNDAVWLDLTKEYTIDTENSSIVFTGDLSETLRNSMFLKFGGTHLYKIASVEVDSGTTIAKLSPDIFEGKSLLIKQEYYPGYLKCTDIPVYINEVSHQPSVTFTYTEAAAHTGYAEILIDDSKLTISETVDGSVDISKTVTFEFANYNNVYDLGLAINETESFIEGHKPYYVNVGAYKSLYEEGTFSDFTILPTYGVNKRLPYYTLVGQCNFRVEYALDPAYTGLFSVRTAEGSIILKEELTHSVDGYSEQQYVLYYSNYSTVYELFNAINSTVSTITNGSPFSVTTLSGSFTPADFFTRGQYNIPSTVEEVFSSLPKKIPATTYTANWILQGPLNIRRSILDTDYSISGGAVTFTSPLLKRDRYLLNYLGLNTLAEFETEDINVYCRYFSSLPTGSRVDAYMDYLNVDQYYIQKLTERKFLENVSVPQVGDLLKQKGGGGGSGADSGSNDTFPNYQAGNANLYYLLRDEQIKKLIYLKIYKWYKQRLRYFAAEAQLSLGFKFGNSTHYWTDGVNYSLLDSLVEEDINYTLTSQEIIDQVANGFSVFFPIGYSGVSPKYYDRFGTEYKDYKDVYCYNIQYLDDNTRKGKVRSWKPYWAPKQDGKHSDLDYLILKNRNSELVQGYSVPFYSGTGIEGNNFKDELIYDSESNNFSFLKRVRVGDSVKINKNKKYYKIGGIENRLDPLPGVGDYAGEISQPLIESLILEDGKYFTEKGIRNFKVSKYQDVFPGNEKWLYRYTLSAGYLATESEIDKFVNGLKNRFGFVTPQGSTAGAGGVQYIASRKAYYDISRTKKANGALLPKHYIDVYVLFDILETTFTDKGHRIYIKKTSADSFPVYNDEGNYGVTMHYDKIDNQVTGKNRIKKPLTMLEVLSIMFPIPFAFFPEADELFETTAGSFDEDTGEYLLGSYDYTNDSFTANDEDSQKTINLKYLSFFDERRVDAVLDALENNVATSENLNSDDKIEIDGIIYDGKTEDGSNHSPEKLSVGDVLPTHLQKGLGKFFDIDFERTYKEDDVEGYIDSIFFRTKDRDIWFQFPDNEGDDEVTKNYGVPVDKTLKGFYDPGNLYTKLVLEKQAWLTEELIVQDIYDVQLKMARAFKDGILNAGSGPVAEGSVASNISHSQFQDYLITIGNTIKTRMEKYVGIISFLLSNAPGDLGPLVGILQEDDASGPIIDSYEKATTAYNTYSFFYSKTFGEASSFYNRVIYNLEQWNSAYIRWVLSLREGTIFQLQAKEGRLGGLVPVGFNLLDAIKLNYLSATDAVILSNPKATIDYDYVSLSLRLVLEADYQQAPDFNNPDLELDSGKVEAKFVFSSYPTLDTLVEAINSFEYPLGEQLFTSVMLFKHYPKGEYATSRLSPFGATEIPTEGFTLEALNVDDHRQHDSRVLFLNKKISDLLTLDNEPSINPWPTYISNYPKKNAIQGLKVPGSWETLPSSSYDVLKFRALQDNYGVSYLVTAVYDEEVLDDLTNDQTLNLVLTDRSRVKPMIGIIQEIDNSGILTSDQFDFINETDTSKNTKNTFIKFLTVKLSYEGVNLKVNTSTQKTTTISTAGELTVRFNTRRFRTINALVDAMNGYFYKDSKGEWQPVEVGTDVTDPMYVKLFEAEVLGDVLDQGESSSFEIQIPYEPIIKSFKVGPYTQTAKYLVPNPLHTTPIYVEKEEEYYVDKNNILLGWVPEIKKFDKTQYITLRLNDELEYSPGNTYGFNPSLGENARMESIRINSSHPNANLLPFDMYSWDDNATYEIRNNWFLMRSTNTQEAIPMTGAVGEAVFVPAVNNFVISGESMYPDLEGETLGDLVNRINSSAANDYFYANLKFVREENEEGSSGYFEYTYLPNSSSSIPKASLENLYLEDDNNVMQLSPNRAENAQYLMNQDSPTTIDTLTITSDVKVFRVSLNTSGYSSLSNATYNFDTGGSSLDLTTDYVCSINYYTELDLSSYATVTDLVNGIDGLVAPLLTGPSVALFNATAIVAGADPTTLSVSNTVSVPPSRSLKDTLNNTVLTLDIASIVDTRISMSTATIRVNAGRLVLTAVLTYTGSYSGSVSLAQAISNVSYGVTTQYPLGDDGTYLPPLFTSSIISSAYNSVLGTSLNDSGGVQALTNFVDGTISTSEVFSTTYTVEDLVNSINSKSALTGVDASYVFLADPGYKKLQAKYLAPATGDSYGVSNDLLAAKNLGALFSNEVALKLLFMEVGGSFVATQDSLSVTSSLGTKVFPQDTDKNMHAWIASITGDFNNGLRGIDVLPLKIISAPYGRLASYQSSGIVGNEPTHVHFEFLGDFRFYQISDYNLFSETNMIKQRLAKPWKKDDGTFESDWYNDVNFYDSFYGNSVESPDGNTIAIHKDKFLGYLKNTRFNEIKNSIESEQLVNNKYLWLYLKLHKEIGCDQKVRDYLKKVKEDEEDANRLPQDL